MLPLPTVFSPNVIIARTLNALLRREPWAAERLSRHAGKSLRFNVGTLRAAFSIEASGHLTASDPAIVPDVTLTIGSEHLADLPGILRSRDVNAITNKLHVQGDAALATLVSELARDLRWDVEDDLANRFGDVLGPKIWQGGRSVLTAAQAGAERAAANVAEYLGEEGRVLLTRPALHAFQQDCAALARRLEALEQRFGRIDTEPAKGRYPGPTRSGVRQTAGD